jgi:Mrp family chromosome partitioning ATPase
MEHESGAGAWLDDALHGAGIDPARLARVESTRRPVVERSNPWGDAEDRSPPARILDAARGAGTRQGQLIFVTDPDEDPIARVQAAVQLARVGVDRGMDVLLVDSDIRHVGLSRWLPDRDLDAEGLVDVLQYGASIDAVRRPSEIEGIDVVGVGSYRPDLSGIFGADDARRLHAQLRKSASLVIIVGPTRLADGQFHPLMRGVDSVVVSMHADAALAHPLEELLAHLTTRQLPLSGMFLWAGPADSDLLVDDALLERSRVLPPANTGSPFPARQGDDQKAPRPLEDEPTVPVSPAGEPEEIAAPPVQQRAAASREGAPASLGSEEVRVRVTTERGGDDRRTSGMLRLVLAVVAVGVVAFLAWWAFTWQSVEPTRPRIQPPERRPTVARVQTPAPETVEPQTTATDTSGAVTSGGSEGIPDRDTRDDSVAEPELVETSRDLDGLLDQPVESGPGEAENGRDSGQPTPPGSSTATESEEPDAFDSALRRSGSGWGLHLFSFPDSMEAVVDGERLEREGYAVAVRGADIRGQRWYRVLVGDFADRAEAARHREQAQEKFHVDWVGVVKK